MILFLDTSSPIVKMLLIEGGYTHEYEWEANRTLARDLLKKLNEFLDSQQKTWDDIDGLGVFKGPGSFTGLRIGLTVMNTIANAKNIPIVGGTGEDWRVQVEQKLTNGEDDRIVIPFYGAEANITAPRK